MTRQIVQWIHGLRPCSNPVILGSARGLQIFVMSVHKEPPPRQDRRGGFLYHQLVVTLRWRALSIWAGEVPYRARCPRDVAVRDHLVSVGNNPTLAGSAGLPRINGARVPRPFAVSNPAPSGHSATVLSPRTLPGFPCPLELALALPSRLPFAVRHDRPPWCARRVVKARFQAA